MSKDKRKEGCGRSSVGALTAIESRETERAKMHRQISRSYCRCGLWLSGISTQVRAKIQQRHLGKSQCGCSVGYTGHMYMGESKLPLMFCCSLFGNPENWVWGNTESRD